MAQDRVLAFQQLLGSIDLELVPLADGLVKAGYGSEKRLRAATKAGLLSVEGVRQGDADLLIDHFQPKGQPLTVVMTMLVALRPDWGGCSR
jgi:hypothetical protein